MRAIIMTQMKWRSSPNRLSTNASHFCSILFIPLPYTGMYQYRRFNSVQRPKASITEKRRPAFTLTATMSRY